MCKDVQDEESIENFQVLHNHVGSLASTLSIHNSLYSILKCLCPLISIIVMPETNQSTIVTEEAEFTDKIGQTTDVTGSSTDNLRLYGSSCVG